MEAQEKKMHKYVHITAKIKVHLHLESVFELQHVDVCATPPALMGYSCINDLWVCSMLLIDRVGHMVGMQSLAGLNQVKNS